jgi:anti-sigma28 factor (negative regulator of flagellin synthesis)
MKVNDPNVASLASTAASKAQESGAATPIGRSGSPLSPAPASADDVHLSELVRSLRSLAADSPERLARIEQIARDYASGSYQADTKATASKVIDDALKS